MGKDYRKYLSQYKRNDVNQNVESNMMMMPFEKPGMIDIYSRMLDDRIIFINDDIDTDLAEYVKAQLLYLDSIEKKNITIYINSGGGSVYDGLSILDTMDYIRSKVTTINTGLAASMAAVILCYGDKRKALKRSRTMIHQPLSYGGEFIQQASDIEINFKEINSLKHELYEIISKCTGQKYEKVQRDGDRDYWMKSTDALEYGMIDEIIESKKKKN